MMTRVATTTTTTTTMDPTVRRCFARNHARVCPVPPQHRHRPMSSHSNSYTGVYAPHRNHRPCVGIDDNDDDNDDNNNTSMRHAYTPVIATTSLKPIEARGGNESKEAAKEAEKVTQVWKETSEPYNAIPPKKQKTQTRNKKIVRTYTVPNEEETDAHAAVQRAHHDYKKEKNVWMDNTCMPKDSASAWKASTTTTRSKLCAWCSHKEENHKHQRKKKDNTQKNIKEITSNDGNNPSNVSWATWHGARCGTSPIPVKKVVEESRRMESRRSSHSQTSMKTTQRNQLCKVRFVIGWGKLFVALT